MTHEENEKDITWMTEQRNRLKAECDELAVKNRQLVAQDSEQRRAMQLVIDAQHKDNIVLITIAEKRRVALADVLKLTAAVLEKCAPLVAE